MKVTINVNADTIRTVANGLQRRQARVASAGAAVLANVSAAIFIEAQANVPVQTGALRASGNVTVKYGLNNYKAVISYGDSRLGLMGRTTAEYAPERHEMMSHLKPLSFKWLERAVRNGAVTYRDELILKIAQALR